MKKLLVFGAKGMVGSVLVQEAQAQGLYHVIAAARDDVDLTQKDAVHDYIQSIGPDIVMIPAAKVGGIVANNTYPVDFLYQNIAIALNTIEACHKAAVKMVLFMGSSCIYPKYCEQPISEEALLTSPLEPTNESYAIAKIAGLKACEAFNRQFDTDFRGIMPTNLYGVNDNYHPTNSHVIPGLIRRMHEAKINNDREVLVWGSGKPLREFLFARDLAKACLKIVEIPKARYYQELPPGCSHMNVGAGEEVSIRDLAEKIKSVIGLNSEIIFDNTKPDGAPRKKLNSSRIRNLGWTPEIMLDQGLKLAYEDFLLSRSKA